MKAINVNNSSRCGQTVIGESETQKKIGLKNDEDKETNQKKVRKPKTVQKSREI